MSFEPDRLDEELETVDLLASILSELKLLNLLIKEMTGFQIDAGDVDG